MLLIVLSVLITLTAVLAALLGANDPDTTQDNASTGPSAAPNWLGARLIGADPSTSGDETRWLTMRGDEPRPRRQTRSAQSGTVIVPEQGPGDFRVATAANQPLPHDAFTYTVEVEGNLPFAQDAVARLVDATLTDPRSWSDDSSPLVRVDTASTVRILLATPATADALCAPLETRGRLSCRNGANVVINAWRWVNGAPGYTNLLNYRRYVINHEVGHALGHAHAQCPGPGRLSPVMLQQTLGFDGCRPNPWPEPALATSGSNP